MANYFSNQEQDNRNRALTDFGNLTQQEQGSAQSLSDLLYGTSSNPGGMYGSLLSNYSNAPQGYTPDQQANILQSDGNGGLNGVSPLTQDQINSFQLTPQEQQGIAGNPNQVLQNTIANNATLGQNVTQGNQNVSNAAATGGAQLQGIYSQSNPLTGQIQGALQGEANTLNAAANNPNLGLSQPFQQNYQFTPQDRQNIVTAAGQAAGGVYAAQQDQLLRNAAASGEVSPLAVNAAEQDLARQGAAAAGNAMTNAQVQAKAAQMGYTQQAEQMRLGTAQDISSRQMQGAEQAAGLQVGANQNLLSGQFQGASQAANMGYNAAQYGAGAMNQATEYATGANMSAGEYADTAGSQRAGQIAGNRQQTSEYGQGTAYNQGMGVNTAVSNRYGNIYGTGLQQGNTLRQGYQGLLQGTAGNLQSTRSAQGSQYGSEYGAANQATSNAYNQQSPSLMSKITSGVGGFLGGFAGGF